MTILIPARFLKDGVEMISAPLTAIISLSPESGIVPEDIKLLEWFQCLKMVIKTVKAITDLYLFYLQVISKIMGALFMTRCIHIFAQII